VERIKNSNCQAINIAILRGNPALVEPLDDQTEPPQLPHHPGVVGPHFFSRKLPHLPAMR
jgi:hypothetical protein